MSDGNENDDIDYKTMYEDLKVKSEADVKTLNENIENLKNTLKTRDDKINELQTYICKNLSTPGKPSDNVSTFEDRYKNAIKEMN